MYQLNAQKTNMREYKNIYEDIKLDDINSKQTNWIDKKFINPKATIKLATMFSGIGAIEFALKRLNLNSEIIFAYDNDKFVKESYFANYKINHKNWYSDVVNIDGKEYKDKIDLLVWR